MPGFAVFASAADVGDGEYAAHFEPVDYGNGEVGIDAVAEAAVAVEDGRVGAVEGQAFFGGDEDGDSGSVFGGREQLPGFVRRRVEIYFGFAEDGGVPVVKS